jgi:hypothetical protein
VKAVAARPCASDRRPTQSAPCAPMNRWSSVRGCGARIRRIHFEGEPSVKRAPASCARFLRVQRSSHPQAQATLDAQSAQRGPAQEEFHQPARRSTRRIRTAHAHREPPGAQAKVAKSRSGRRSRRRRAAKVSQGAYVAAGTRRSLSRAGDRPAETLTIRVPEPITSRHGGATSEATGDRALHPRATDRSCQDDLCAWPAAWTDKNGTVLIVRARVTERRGGRERCFPECSARCSSALRRCAQTCGFPAGDCSEGRMRSCFAWRRRRWRSSGADGRAGRRSDKFLQTFPPTWCHRGAGEEQAAVPGPSEVAVVKRRTKAWLWHAASSSKKRG